MQLAADSIHLLDAMNKKMTKDTDGKIFNVQLKCIIIDCHMWRGILYFQSDT